MDASCVNDRNLNIVVSNTHNSSITLRTSENGYEWIISESQFEDIRHLNLSRSKLENISTTIQKANMDLETLDLSYQFMGDDLRESTFERFVNLKNLYLRQTNISHFQFATFYHQRELVNLDISYNNLHIVDFHLFLRNFQNLVLLNLEGNNLTEIDSVTHSHFQKLSTLGISKNNFTCDYLAAFLVQWPDLTLIDNPSGQIHMAGVDCVHWNSKRDNETTTVQDPEDTDNKTHTYLLKSHLEEISTVKALLIVVVIILLLNSLVFIAIKCKEMKQKISNDSAERNVAYQNQTIDSSSVQRASLLDFHEK